MPYGLGIAHSNRDTRTHDQRVQFPSPSCQNLDADPNLGKCHIGNLTPTHPENFAKKSPPIFEKIKSENFCKIPLFWSYGNFSLVKKLQSTGGQC